MSRFTFNTQTSRMELAEGVTISSVAIKNMIHVESYDISTTDDGSINHHVQFVNGGYFDVTYKGSSISLNAHQCSTNVADDPENNKGVIFTLSPM
ncbi:hypothetical protein Q5V23_004393 [Vibrio fluvialis]|nr:hypothetical protein [Vibrio fluvialis]